MNVLIFILSVSLSFGVYAANPEKEIRKYIKEIEKNQKDIASLLVLQNFSKFMADTDYGSVIHEQVDFFTSYESGKGMGQISDDFFNTIYSDKTDSEKIDSTAKLLIIMRKSKSNWIQLGATVKRSHERFFQEFRETDDICSDHNFYQSMAVLENFTPDGVDASKFRRTWELRVGGSAAFNENGSFDYSGSAEILGPDEGSSTAEARHAVATTAGAAALYAPPPWNVIGAVALPILIEATWGMIDMHKSMKEMDKLAKANQDLYKAMSYEINVKKHFKVYCSELAKAYSEVRPLVLALNEPAGYENLLDALDKTEKFNGESIDFSSTPENFYKFARFKALNDAAIIFGQHEDYFFNWEFVSERINEFTDNIERSIDQIIAHKRQVSGRVSEVAEIFKQIENLNNLKSSFSKELFFYFDTESITDRSDSLKRLKFMVENYRLYREVLTHEEMDVLTSFENAIFKLEQRNA